MRHELRRITAGAAAFTLLAAASVAGAAWSLVPGQSHVTYTSTKVLPNLAASKAENNHFKTLSGSVSDTGDAAVHIDLGSVATNVDIRDERMRNMVFETGTFPDAAITAQVPVDMIAVAGIHQIDLSFNLSIKGMSKTLSVPAMVVSTGDNLVVSSLQPVLVSAADFGLDGGITELTKVAGLMYIPATVPVTFNLVFQK
ncbi:MAG: YceI family protein [Gammaproteobacteria bacterium]|nr:YceI family protein [Gammaproteobacteria bacterium]